MKITKTHMWIALGVIVILVAMAIFFYYKGKHSITTQVLPGDLPGNPGSGSVSGASNDEIKNVATGLYKEMAGPNLLGHKMEFYKRALLFSDTDIVKLYNTFNASYEGSSGETLTQWLDSQMFSSTFENEGNLLTDRLKKLNCL